MTESGISEKVKALSAARQLTGHDRRLYLNDPIVHNIATMLAKAMLEYGIPKVAAAFRAALFLKERDSSE